MATKHAVIIGVEKYQDRTIKPVEYAEADAREFGVALAHHGFDSANQVVLTSAGATKNVIESRLRRLIKRLADDDVLCFFYAGHGFSKNDQNYITCHDSLRGDLAGTSIALQTIFEQLKASKCKRVLMFLDACEAGMTATADMRGIYSMLTPEELEAFFEGAEYHACFAACKGDEYSYPSNGLGHGVWTYHVLEALLGKAPLAVETKGLVTAASLQSYLAREVPSWMAKNRTDGAVQTPWFYGTQSHEFMIADVAALVAERKRASKPVPRSLRRAVLSRTFPGGRIRSLSGFKRGHTVPDRVNEATTRFLGQCAESELKEDLDKVHARLREHFKYARKDIKPDVSETMASIVTPDFEYTVSVSLDPDDPSEVIWKRELSNIRDPTIVERKELAAVFGATFDTVELEFKEPLELAEFIDALEAAGLTPNYDAECTECTLTLSGVPGTIRVTDSCLQIVQSSPEPPMVLVQAFQKAHALLNGKVTIALPVATD